MEVLSAVCCGLDVHQASVPACLRSPGDGPALPRVFLRRQRRLTARRQGHEDTIRIPPPLRIGRLLRKDSGLVDAPGRWLRRTKGDYPFVPLPSYLLQDLTTPEHHAKILVEPRRS
jgi:hypothetical protein